MTISIKTAVAIGSGLLVLGAGLGVAGVASADTPGVPYPTTAPTIAPAPGNPQPQTEVPGWPMSPQQEQVLVETLSSMLGVDEVEVKAALDQVHADYAAKGPAALDPWLDKAVQAGILTQDEADALREAVEQGGINLGPR
ncbi:MAG TPA: hypothetical protein VNC13_01410 [Propionibacteriaceae bacterium]|nr:hypothetical protein [Propionibacteriaceae bacterium]